ncbi:hypothetical protein GOV10_05030 [Candidatus Woesearchaeota archaeon]|nr:hypothetical protein [Candidatus Woesearchaeota archaeon]
MVWDKADKIPLESIHYAGKEFSVGPRLSHADIKSRKFKKTDVDPKAVDLLVVYAQDYFRVYHPILHTFEYMKRLIEGSSVYDQLKKGTYKKLPEGIKERVNRYDLNEYRIDGDMEGNSIRLAIDCIDHRRQIMAPAELSDEQVQKFLTKYVYEIQRYNTASIPEKMVKKAVAPWRRELRLSPESANLLSQRVLENNVHYRVKEQPLVGFLMFRYLKTGGVKTIGQRYKRNPIPLLDWADFLSPLVDLVTDASQFGPKESGIENPSELGVFIPRGVMMAPLLGKRVMLHQLRHALHYSCFFELLSPESPIYDEFGNDRVEKAYDTLEDMIVKDKIYEEGMPNFITENFFRGKGLDFFREHNSLEDLEQRSILATSLYLKENMKGHVYREALTHSALNHLTILAAPWLLLGIGLGIVTPYIPPAINAALLSQGHGNLFAYGGVFDKLRKCQTPYEELYALATLGN